MAAVIPEASVVRASAHSQGTGVRPHAGADQPESPFSELLETSEAPEADAAEPTSPSPDVPGKKALPAEAKAIPPKGPPESPPGKDGAKGQSELVLSIVLPPGHTPDAQVPVVRHGLGATLSEAISNRPQPESETETEAPELPAQTDAATDVTALAPLASQPVAVPVPAPLPAPGEATVPVEGDAAIPATAEAAVPMAAEATIPSVTDRLVSAPVAAPVQAPAATSPQIDAKAPTSPAPDVKGEAAAVEVAAPIGQAADATPPVRSGAKEKKAEPAEKVARVTTGAATSTKKAAPVASKPAMDAEVSPDPETSAQDAEISAQKPAIGSTDSAAVVKAARADVEMPDSKTKSHAPQPVAENPANSTSLPPPPFAHVASQHATRPSSERPGLTDMVPVAGLAVAIAAHAQGGKNHFEIRLDPPELGRIDVRLDVDSDGQVTSHLRVERAETLDLLRRDAPALERALQQAGLKTLDNGLQFSLRDHAFSQHNQGRETPAMARIVVPDEKLVPAETQRNYGRLAGLGTGVDIRV